MQFGAFVRGLLQKRRSNRIRRSLLRCGKELFFDDAATMTIVHPGRLAVGDNVGFNAYVFINAMGGITIGDDTRFGPFAVLHSGDHAIDDLSQPIRCAGHKKEPIAIGADVWIGAHAIILRGSSIPDHCVIGAGALVDRRLQLKPYDIVRGNPGRVVGNRLEKYGPRQATGAAQVATGELVVG